MMGRKLELAASLILACIGTTLAPAAQQPTFRTHVDLVRVDALVVKDGRIVPGLTITDFEVFDNGVPQKIERVAREEVPLALLLVFDTSRSVLGERLANLVAAGQELLSGLTADDRIGFMTFDDAVLLRVDFTDDKGAVRDALGRLAASGSTSLLDALYAGLVLNASNTARPMTVLFGDGRDTSSWTSRETVFQAARESEAVIYSVGIKPDRAGRPFPNPDNLFLEELSDQTGGRFLLSESSQRLKEVFVEILQEMKARYLLTYYPNGVPREGWHDIVVRVPTHGAEVRARKGYLVQP